MGNKQKREKATDIGPIINALLAEYNIVHERVLQQVSQYQTTNIKILMLVGVLVYFGITNFSAGERFNIVFVNVVFLIALPLISICSVLFSFAHLTKVMILGDYLKTVEDKINKTLAQQAEKICFPRGKVMDWEYWRVKHGHAKGGIGILSEISFSLIVVLLTVIVSFFSGYERLKYIRIILVNSKMYHDYRFIIILFVALLIVVLIISLIVFAKRRHKTLENVQKQELTYE